MKLKLLIPIFATVIICSCVSNENDQFVLNCNLDQTGQKVHIVTYDIVDNKLIDEDTLNLENNSFQKSFNIDKPLLVQLAIIEADSIPAISFYAIPGETCNLTGSWNDYKFDGSQFYKDLNDIELTLAPERNRLFKLSWECESRSRNGEDISSISEYFMAQSEPINKSLNEKVWKLLQDKAETDAVVSLLTRLELEDVEKALGMISDKAKNGKMKAIVDFVSDNVKKTKQMEENAESVGDGKPAPDFTLNDINGQPLSLKSLQGKYLLLDFWGSWCGWCIKGIPDMKECYKKYADKLEILGVDCNDSEEDWKEAVKKHEMPWKHVRNTEADNVTELYAIQGFPTKVIIDPQGIILKTYIGEDPEFYTYIDQIMK